MRSRVDEEPLRSGRKQLIVTEIPYEVNKSSLVKRIDELRADKKVDGIVEVRDETDRTGLRIAIEKKMLIANQSKTIYIRIRIYKFHIILIWLLLVKVAPKLMGLREIIESYLNHQIEVVTNRTRYDLEQAENVCILWKD